MAPNARTTCVHLEADATLAWCGMRITLSSQRNRKTTSVFDVSNNFGVLPRSPAGSSVDCDATNFALPVELPITVAHQTARIRRRRNQLVTPHGPTLIPLCYELERVPESHLRDRPALLTFARRRKGNERDPGQIPAGRPSRRGDRCRPRARARRWRWHSPKPVRTWSSRPAHSRNSKRSPNRSRASGAGPTSSSPTSPTPRTPPNWPRAAVEAFGKLDIVVNNVGGTMPEHAAEHVDQGPHATRSPSTSRPPTH